MALSWERKKNNMWTAIGLTSALCFLFVLVVWLAQREGKKSAKLEALKAEAKRNAEEQRRAQEIANSVANMSTDNARRLLHDVANKQSNRLH